MTGKESMVALENLEKVIIGGKHNHGISRKKVKSWGSPFGKTEVEKARKRITGS